MLNRIFLQRMCALGYGIYPISQKVIVAKCYPTSRSAGLTDLKFSRPLCFNHGGKIKGYIEWVPCGTCLANCSLWRQGV